MTRALAGFAILLSVSIPPRAGARFHADEEVAPEADPIAPVSDQGPAAMSAPPESHEQRLGLLGGLGRDFGPLGRDFLALASLETVAILSTGGALCVAATEADLAVQSRVGDLPKAEEVFFIGDALGDAPFLGGSAVGLYVFGRLFGQRRMGDLGRDLIRAQVVDLGLTHGAKAISWRSRPDGLSGSFPSGHTSGTFTMATVVQRHFGWKGGLPAFALATYVGASRLQEDRHYPSDVIFGAAVGITAGFAVSYRGQTLEVAPLASRNGVGLQVVARSAHR